MKLPNFLHIDPEPFDEATFVGEENEPDDEEGDGAGRVKLKIENTLRWRQSKTTGEMVGFLPVHDVLFDFHFCIRNRMRTLSNGLMTVCPWWWAMKCLM